MGLRRCSAFLVHGAQRAVPAGMMVGQSLPGHMRPAMACLLRFWELWCCDVGDWDVDVLCLVVYARSGTVGCAGAVCALLGVVPCRVVSSGAVWVRASRASAPCQVCWWRGTGVGGSCRSRTDWAVTPCWFSKPVAGRLLNFRGGRWRDRTPQCYLPRCSRPVPDHLVTFLARVGHHCVCVAYPAGFPSVLSLGWYVFWA